MALALIRWINGRDEGKYTVLKTSWIKGFEEADFLDGRGDESYVIEWRKSKKEPLGGWPVYDGEVVEISDSEVKLNKALDELAQTPAKNCDIGPSETEKFQGKVRPKTARALDILRESKQQWNNENRPSATNSHELYTVKRFKREMDGLKSELEELKDDKFSLQEENLKLKEDVDFYKDQIISEFPRILSAMDAVLQKVQNISTSKSDANSPTCQPDKIELYPGTGVMVTVTAYHQAKLSKTMSCFVGSLLPNLFSMAELLESNYKGGKSKLPIEKSAQRKALNKDIVTALYSATFSAFPSTRREDFGKAINNKLNNIRYKFRLASQSEAETEENV